MKNRGKILACLTALCCIGSMAGVSVFAQTSEAEPNDTMEAATEIALNSPVQGVCDTGSDWFSISIPEDGRLDVGVCQLKRWNDSHMWSLSVCDAQGTVLKSCDQDDPAFTTVLTVESLPAGTYYLCMSVAEPWNNPVEYSITARFGEFIPTGDTDSNGTTDAADASIILNESCLMGASTMNAAMYWTMTMEQAFNADVDQNGNINAIDASIILKYSAAAGSGDNVVLSDFVE